MSGTIYKTNSQDCGTIKYSYDSNNRLISEIQNDYLEIRTGYQGNTHLITHKLTVVNNKIVEREFYQYDKNAIQIRKIKDNGSNPDQKNLTDVTYRLITEIEPQLNPKLPGLTHPKSITEWYRDTSTGQKVLLKKTERVYSRGGRLAEEKIFDANSEYRYSNYYEYNKALQLVKEVNGLGEVTIYDYDGSDNKIYEEKIGSGKKTRFIYNLADQLVEEIEEHDSLTLKKIYTYDVMGNRVSTTDIYGCTTQYEFDLASREIVAIDYLGKTERRDYDIQGNLASFQDKDGYMTKTQYGLLGKPLEISYPDHSTESFIYNLQGHLIEKTQRDGTRIEYVVDHKGHILEEKTYSKKNELLKTSSFVYDGDLLVSEVDPLGNITQHEYDGAGRRIATTKGTMTTRFEYDALGHLYKTISDECVSIKEYNILDRVIEERMEDNSGNIFSKVTFQYDRLGNQTVVRQYRDATNFEETQTTYNSLSQPVLFVDALGNPYKTTYTFTNTFKKDTEDPLGRRTIEFYDCYKRLKTQRVRAKDKTLISQVNYDYDGRGNQIKRTHDIFLNGEILGSFSVDSHFDSMNQKIEEIEQNKKSTKWSYKKGKLSAITNPDGTTLTYQYDSLNRVRELLSSDQTIHYCYSYDLCDNLVLVNDLVNNMTTERQYDVLSRITYEKQGTGLEFSYAYDALNRCTSMKFCDGSAVNSYSPTDLIKTTRYRKNTPLYDCLVESNWAGKPVKIALPNQTTILYGWDDSGRCTLIDSKTYREQLSYNSVGKLTKIKAKDAIDSYQSTYGYDDLDQIISEKGIFSAQYTFDSINNRRQKNDDSCTISEFNQIVDDRNQKYSYDINGRRKSNSSCNYSYDALGRLIAFSDSQITTKYIYDSFGRRIRTVTPTETINYLYQLDIEIGTYQNGLKEFRLLGDGHDTLAIEIDDTIYAALTNHRGDIVQLINSNSVAANYRYDAFGNFQSHGPKQSPWLFFGQRYNPQANLYHFCRREYDPSNGSWLTPDPLGYADGPNLYAYVHNNPLTYVDPYGLFTEQIKEFNRGMSRGALDDTSWGVSEFALGEFQQKSGWGTAGYYAGTGTSMAAGLLYGGTELKMIKGGISLGLKGISKGFHVAKKFIAKKTVAAETKSGIKASQVALDAIAQNANIITETASTVVPKRPLTPRKLREYLSNLDNISKEQLMKDAQKLDLTMYDFSMKGHLEFFDINGKLRLKIHPPDKRVTSKTKYHHIHLYDRNGNSLSKELLQVKPNAPQAHIPYGGNLNL